MNPTVGELNIGMTTLYKRPFHAYHGLPEAGADQMIGREPARRRVAARAPARVVGPGIDVDPVLDAEPHRVRIVRVRLREAELALEQPGAAAGVDDPACAQCERFAALLHLAGYIAEKLDKGLPIEKEAWSLEEDILLMAGLGADTVEACLEKTRTSAGQMESLMRAA